MEYIFAVVCLLAIPLFLGFKHFQEYYDAPFSRENFGITSLFALIVYFSYFCIFIYFGIDGLYVLEELGDQSRKFITFFIYPSVGFGMAIFPKVASEYVFNAFSMNMLRIQYQICAFTGWTLIVYLVSILAF